MIGIMYDSIYSKKLETILKSKNINAKVITARQRDKTFKQQINHHEIIQFVSSPTLSMKGIIALIRLKLWGKKIIITWIGTDVLLASKKSIPRFLTKFGRLFVNKHLVVSPNLADELKILGIKALVQPFPFYSLYEITNLPDENKVVVYLPDSTEERWEMFQGDLIKKLVNDFLNVEFLIIANSGKYFSEKNVKCIEWVENMENIFSQVRAVIRLPKHDGLSNTIIEAHSMGRLVISSPTTIPFCKIIKSYEELKQSLTEVLDKSMKTNEKASKYVHEELDVNNITQEIISIYNQM